MKDILTVTQLTKEFEPGKGAIDVDIKISKGEIVGFIGPNGAGKTTTTRMIMGLLRKDMGSIEILGQKLYSLIDFNQIYDRVNFLPSEPAYYSKLTVKRMLQYACRFKGNYSTNLRKAYEYADLLNLDIKREISKLSLGNKRKVGVLLTLIGDPELLILDEPTSGLDPLIQQTVLELVSKEAEKGTGVLLSSHNLSEIERFCDKIIIIKDAKIVFTGRLEEVQAKKQKRVRFTVTDETQYKRLTKGVKSSQLNYTNNSVTVLTTDHFTLTKAIINEGIEDFTVENPNLEEMFISYYQ